jgi:formylglycine-generating enzyme required for sulfatase activity
VTRLEALKRVRDLVQEADTIWPATEAELPDMSRWLAAAKEVVAGRPRHAATLAELERRDVATPGAPARVAGRFDAQFNQWWRESLTQLLQGIDALAADEPLRVGTIAEMERRVARAGTLRTRSLDDHAEEWRAAQAALAADPRFDGLVLAPQLGLVPIGADPGSRFQEFWHVESGERPLRDPATQKLLLTEASGLVLVLLPGGRFLFGAQSKEVAAPQYDPDAHPDDDTVELELTPFFLSKYEMTQAQWLRAMGANPSRHRPQPSDCPYPHTLLHPVESVSWIDSTRALRRLALDLPTSAQWEYAARAGTAKVYFASDDPRALRGLGNLYDLAFAARSQIESLPLFDWNDGFSCSAPVGSFAPNGFGLLDIVGNVMEGCRDRFFGRHLGTDFAPGDGEQRANRAVRSSGERIVRGSDFFSEVHFSRASFETSRPEDSNAEAVGIRPARKLER